MFSDTHYWVFIWPQTASIVPWRVGMSGKNPTVRIIQVISWYLNETVRFNLIWKTDISITNCKSQWETSFCSIECNYFWSSVNNYPRCHAYKPCFPFPGILRRSIVIWPFSHRRNLQPLDDLRQLWNECNNFLSVFRNSAYVSYISSTMCLSDHFSGMLRHVLKPNLHKIYSLRTFR